MLLTPAEQAELEGREAGEEEEDARQAGKGSPRPRKRNQRKGKRKGFAGRKVLCVEQWEWLGVPSLGKVKRPQVHRVQMPWSSLEGLPIKAEANALQARVAGAGVFCHGWGLPQKRTFVFLHRYVGKKDVLGKAMVAEAEKEKIKVKVISCDRSGEGGQDFAGGSTLQRRARLRG